MTTKFPAIWWKWDDAGECMRPISAAARSYFAHGELYRLAAEEERSQKQHSWFFVNVANAWGSIRETDKRFPTPEHLRKYALIKCDYYDLDAIPLETRKEARQVAGWVRKRDSFAVMILEAVDDADREGPTVLKIYTAKSQSVKEMPDPKDFKESIDKVLNWIADELGIDIATLRKQRGSA